MIYTYYIHTNNIYYIAGFVQDLENLES